MAKLSDQQERFCQALLNGMSQYDAYLHAGYKAASRNAADATASALTRNPKVVERLKELRAAAAERSTLSATYLADRLERMAAAAFRVAVAPDESGVEKIVSKDAADIVRNCSMDAARLLGLVIEKRENINRNFNEPTELDEQTLLDIARSGSDGDTEKARGSSRSAGVH